MKRSNKLKEISIIVILTLILTSISVIAYTKNEQPRQIILNKHISSNIFNNIPTDIGSKKIVWDNGLHEEGLKASQYDEDWPFDCFQADDFLFDEPTSIDGVKWYCGYWGGDPEPFDWFISFYLDDGSNQFPDGLPHSPSFAGPFCFTDEVIEKEQTEPCCFYMKVDLPEIITFEAEEKYWISIWGQGPLFPQCGWGYHSDFLLNPAVWGSDTFEIIYWTPGKEVHGQHHDMVFQLVYTANNPPSAPIIDGPTSGNPDTEYCFTFHSTDSDGDNVEYLIDWGDSTTLETDYYPSCEPIELCHTWSEGHYVIRCMAIDEHGAESNWTEHEITIPRTRASSYLWYESLLERFPILNRILFILK